MSTDQNGNATDTVAMLEQIKSMLTSHEARLAGIERRLGLTLANATSPSFVTPPSSPLTAPPTGPVTEPAAGALTSSATPFTRPVPRPMKSPTAQSDETGSGHWLGGIAVACFVLAAGFIIKLSIDSGWLTPERQLGLATLFGFSLIGTGFWLAKTDREYASFLPAAGIIVLYMTAFAAHRFYNVLSFESALIATSVISGLCIWVYTEVRHDLYPLTAAVGSYLAPIILDMNSTTVFSAYYFLLCSASFATVSVWVQSRTLAIVASYLAIATTAILGFSLGQNELVAILLALHLFVFAIGTVLQTKYSGVELTETAAGAYFPVLVLFYATEYYFISKINPSLAPWCSLGFAAFLIALYLTAKSWSPERSLASRTVILGFTTLVCFHSGYLELLPKAAHPWLVGAILLAAALLPSSFLKSSTESSRAFLFPRLAIFAIIAIEYVSLVYALMVTKDGVPKSESIPAAMFTLATLWIYIGRLISNSARVRVDSQIPLIAAHVLAIVGFYQIASPQGSLAVSAAWLVYAVIVISFAFKLKDEVMAKSALGVLGLAAAKALIYDASSAPTLIRILCLLITGVVLYGAGFLMRRISSWHSQN